MHKRPINFGSSIGKPKHKPNVANPKIIAPIEVIVRYTSIYDVTWASNGWLMRCFMASGFSHCYSSIIGMIIYYPFLLTLIMFNPYIYILLLSIVFILSAIMALGVPWFTTWNCHVLELFGIAFMEFLTLPCSADSPWCDSPAGGAPEMARNVLQIEGRAEQVLQIHTVNDRRPEVHC